MIDNGVDVNVWLIEPGSAHSKSYNIAVCRSTHPNAISSTFETKLARLEYVDNGGFFRRHTGQWIELYELLRLLRKHFDASRA